jgi:hypothetical protein
MFVALGTNSVRAATGYTHKRYFKADIPHSLKHIKQLA